ncbi:hypothetical protein JZ751_027091 [Albula glossodonta]|uniref:Hexosyltransferase n=1 Tax=Albula glossodonta TaxID=121402 RepID=A0A8T2NFQ6_9TELE|nr:hypothetical protein JZ751_027091 [Albula glossodonta]
MKCSLCCFLVLILCTSILVFIYSGNYTLLFVPHANDWWERISSKNKPRTVPIASQQPSPDPTSSSMTIEPQWEEPGPFHVAYPGKYHFILDEPDACIAQSPFLVLMVPVAPQNLAARDAIRWTWGNESLVLGKTVRLFFMLGLPSGAEAERLQEEVYRERAEHHDLLQSNFLDSYCNLTIKTIMMLEWVASRCPNTPYGMKIDSDMFLNVHNLVAMLQAFSQPQHNYLTGYVGRNRTVVRERKSKWYLPVDVYPENTYPPYTFGFGYVFSIDLAGKIVEASKKIRPLYIEDVHVGLCLKNLGISPTEPSSPSLFKVYPPVPFNRCHYASAITTIMNSPAHLIQCWEDLHKPGPPC